MRRVRIIRTVRPILSATTLSFVVVIASLYAIGREVWVARVFENMPSLVEVTAVARFFLSAFAHTGFAVQVLSVLAIAASLWFLRDALRNLRVLAFAR